jgi:hypothetical protein
MKANSPTFDLSTAQALVLSGDYELTESARGGMEHLGFIVDDVEACVCALTPADFHKSDPSRTKPGFLLDVYRRVHSNRRVYVKFQVLGETRNFSGHQLLRRFLNIVSFKEK